CFCFRAEDGIRDDLVTGVQTCALPISTTRARTARSSARPGAKWLPATTARAGSLSAVSGVDTTRTDPESGRPLASSTTLTRTVQIGRASCRERVTVRGHALAGEDETGR